MITERTPDFSFGTPRRRNELGDWIDDIANFGFGTGSDWSFDIAPTDLFAQNPSGIPSAYPSLDLSLTSVPTSTIPGGSPTTSPNVDTSSFDWSGALSTLTKTAATLAPAALSIYKAATAEGQPTQNRTAPPGYYYTPTGQLAPLSTGGGMSWVTIALLAAGAYFLAKK